MYFMQLAIVCPCNYVDNPSSYIIIIGRCRGGLLYYYKYSSKILVEVSPIAIVCFWETALGCLLCPIWLICLMNAYGDPNWTRLARDE